jgi:hypothetical protein
MNARNGKIARLPRQIRNELNQRLERSEPGPKLLAWLNALPEVKELLEDEFDGVPISKQNLSEWRQGGFQEWLGRCELCGQALDLREVGQDVEEEIWQGVLADDAATVLAIRFGTLLSKWNGEVDEKFEARARVLNQIGRTVIQLQRGTHRSRREDFELDQKRKEEVKREEEEMQEQLTRPIFDMVKARALATMFGGGKEGQKIAEYVLAIRRGQYDAELDITPTDKNKGQKPVAKKPKSVKPTRNRRTAKKAIKNRAKKAVKPLKEKEMDSAKKEECGPEQSSQVKLGKTSLAPMSATEVEPFVPSVPSPNVESVFKTLFLGSESRQT